MAQERELDLVEVAPQAQPPVARLMDYGRFKFEALKREKESRREHNVVRLKEMKLRPKISEHDFQTKFGYVRHFLQEGDKVKLTIMFRGREMVHQEYGRRLLDRMANELKEVAAIERNPLVEGRNMIMIMSPLAKKQSKGPQGQSGPQSTETAEATTPAATTEEPVAEPSTTRSNSSDAQDQNP
jgi:translation initiation factor IF-3